MAKLPSNTKEVKLKRLYKQLDALYDDAFRYKLEEGDKLVIFSDLHMGDGSPKDDFRSNAGLFKSVIEKFYFKNEYKLILNGDVEELLRYPIGKITKRWKKIYDVFRMYHAENRLFKTVGNHDMLLTFPDPPETEFDVHQALLLETQHGELMVFHGHQASMTYQRINKWVGFILRYIANPLGIRNYSVAHDSRKQYAIEKKVYHYSSFRKRASIIGHTHRPLFESLSKAERLKYRIEQLCRAYNKRKEEQSRKKIKKQIKSHKKELKKLSNKNNGVLFESQLYNSIFHIPCLFNSGCVIGKRGMTCLEITENQISLVHWFDQRISQKYLKKKGYEPEQVEDSDYYRMVLNKEYLDYIFTRINLLT